MNFNPISIFWNCDFETPRRLPSHSHHRTPQYVAINSGNAWSICLELMSHFSGFEELFGARGVNYPLTAP
jgi:hypothetical protein